MSEQKRDSAITIVFQFLVATSPFWWLYGIACLMYLRGDSGQESAVVLGNVVIAALGIWAVVGWLNRRQKPPRDHP